MDIYIQWGDRILCIQNEVIEYFVFKTRWLWYFCCIKGDNLVGDWYHMHVGVGLGALHDLTRVIIAYVLGDNCVHGE